MMATTATTVTTATTALPVVIVTRGPRGVLVELDGALVAFVPAAAAPAEMLVAAADDVDAFRDLELPPRRAGSTAPLPPRTLRPQVRDRRDPRLLRHAHARWRRAA